ncbi:hypothetical protein [Methylorubrum aminovorans]
MLASDDRLGLAGLALLVLPRSGTVLGYDIPVHAVLVGFIMSVVLRHALLILPAVAQVRLPYGPALYGPLLLLHPSVALRVGSDLANWHPGRRWSGILTANERQDRPAACGEAGHGHEAENPMRKVGCLRTGNGAAFRPTPEPASSASGGSVISAAASSSISSSVPAQRRDDDL